MKTICGVSLRGAAYFGASVHICIGVGFFALLLDRMLHQIYYRNLNIDGFKMDKESVIYFGFFLPIGLIIFKAVDKENKTLLKWASGIFLMLQLFGTIVRIKFGHMYSSNAGIATRVPTTTNPKVPVDMNVENFKILSIEILLTLTYLVILYFYVRQLHNFPGRIYGHHHSSIPMYSTSSSFFNENRSHHNHRMTNASFPYNYDPPPPYSSVNNLTTSAEISVTQQQPCSSRSFQISRNLSLKKNARHQQHNNNLSSNSMVNNNTASIPNISSSPVNNLLVALPNAIDSDCPSAPLLDQNGSIDGLGCVNNIPSNHQNSLSNLKDDIY